MCEEQYGVTVSYCKQFLTHSLAYRVTVSYCRIALAGLLHCKRGIEVLGIEVLGVGVQPLHCKLGIGVQPLRAGTRRRGRAGDTEVEALVIIRKLFHERIAFILTPPAPPPQ